MKILSVHILILLMASCSSSGGVNHDGSYTPDSSVSSQDGNTSPGIDDGGTTPAKDSGGQGQDSGSTADTSQKDSTDPSAELCACLAGKPRPAVCSQYSNCIVAADCCTPGSTIPCGVYGNSFDCVQGKCKVAGCQDDDECFSYALNTNQPDAQEYVCQPGLCSGDNDYCALDSKTCVQDEDCCSPGDSTPCGAYPDVWTCSKGQCQYDGCTSHGQCVSYAQANGLPDASSYTCVVTPCYDIGVCMPQPKPCSTSNDCCSSESPIPCGVWGNRYRCENGGCVLDGCANDQDCGSWASTLGLPNASDYGCLVY